MKKTLSYVFLLPALLLVFCGETRPPAIHARNVILIIGDGVGIPTLNAASIHGYGDPLALFLYHMPSIGLSETSAANDWVTDSAAGMTAIMTGVKTNNGVLSQGPDGERGARDGALLKTLLEYAEERGLASGVVSNSPMADATPAACYAHANDRTLTGEIFAQVLKPRFGDGVDVIIGPGRQAIEEATRTLGIELSQALPGAGYVYVEDETAMIRAAESHNRLVALYGGSAFDLTTSANRAIDVLNRNPNGFFLMIESNNHSTNVENVLTGTVGMDRMVKQICERATSDTLVLFAADHSYSLSLPKGPRSEDIVDFVRVTDTHTGEEVLVAARGPGSEAIRGIFPNTALFQFMMDAYGWQQHQ